MKDAREGCAMTKDKQKKWQPHGSGLPAILEEDLAKPIAKEGIIRLQKHEKYIPLYRAARLIANAQHPFNDEENDRYCAEHKQGLAQATIRGDIRIRHPSTLLPVAPAHTPENSRALISIDDIKKHVEPLGIVLKIEDRNVLLALST